MLCVTALLATPGLREHTQPCAAQEVMPRCYAHDAGLAALAMHKGSHLHQQTSLCPIFNILGKPADFES
jgi:hypothetical protein